MLRIIVLSLVLLSSCSFLCVSAAERPILKPQDFLPLTELPWKRADATQESIMVAIFREPNVTIRYGVLRLYLDEIPVEEIGRVFDLAIELEDSQTPDILVESMLRVWAARDPFRCWERVQKLFLVVGLEDGWLMFDDWDVGRSSMLVQDRAAIQASPFRLERWSLIGFPLGVEGSGISSSERVRLMKEFVQQWFMHFDTYPDSPNPFPVRRSLARSLRRSRSAQMAPSPFTRGTMSRNTHPPRLTLPCADGWLPSRLALPIS